jgi:hypothetical protein
MRGITKQEFYRLRSKFRLLKRVYDDPESLPDIDYMISKLSRKPLCPQLVQLVIAEPATEITQTWVESLRQRIWDRKIFSAETQKVILAKMAREVIKHSVFMDINKHQHICIIPAPPPSNS